MRVPIQRFGRTTARHGAQRGATLIVGLVILVLMTLIVINAFVVSSSNLQSVGNMQVRDESIAAANQAVERLISTSFTDALGSQTMAVDINKDGVSDYSVVIATPTCIRAALVGTPPPSDVELPALATGGSWVTEWDIDSMVKHLASGGEVHIRQGIRVALTEAQKMTACP